MEGEMQLMGKWNTNPSSVSSRAALIGIHCINKSNNVCAVGYSRNRTLLYIWPQHSISIRNVIILGTQDGCLIYIIIVLSGINILHLLSNVVVSRQYLIFYGILNKHNFLIVHKQILQVLSVMFLAKKTSMFNFFGFSIVVSLILDVLNNLTLAQLDTHKHTFTNVEQQTSWTFSPVLD